LADFNTIKTAGFSQIEIKKEKSINIPDKVFYDYLPAEDIESFQGSIPGILSITVAGSKQII